jgi:hypothetical protein
MISPLIGVVALLFSSAASEGDERGLCERRLSERARVMRTTGGWLVASILMIDLGA